MTKIRINPANMYAAMYKFPFAGGMSFINDYNFRSDKPSRFIDYIFVLTMKGAGYEVLQQVVSKEAHKIQHASAQYSKYYLEVVAYPGHEGTQIRNNASLVIAPEGLSFCHTNDQANRDDFAWIDEVGEHFQG